jgi:hypothetical protein
MQARGWRVADGQQASYDPAMAWRLVDQGKIHEYVVDAGEHLITNFPK